MQNESHRLWPLIAGTKFADSYIIDYDNYYFNNYNKLVENFENIPKDKIILIDKSCEHLHDNNPNNIKKLNYFLETYNCKHNAVVLDNTYDEHYFQMFNIKHIKAPFYIFHYLAKNNLKVPQWNSKVNYTFVCLNNTHKPHRQEFIEQLQIRGILAKTKWSYRQTIESNVIPTPKFLDQNVGSFNQDANLQQLYQNALLALVTETDYYSNNITHVTEKTLWSIFYGCIPIVVGVPGSIALLKNWGIDVYDDIVDHMYDTETNNKKRMTIIVDQCEKLLYERYPEKIKNLLPVRVLRNQLLLSNKDYWKTQIQRELWNYKY